METLTSFMNQDGETATGILSRSLTAAKSVGEFELKLADSIEMSREDLKERLAAAGRKTSATPDFLEHTRLALLYHEAAIKTPPTGMISLEYAVQCYSMLTTLKVHSLLPEASPLLHAYEASASALIAIQRRRFKEIHKSLVLFKRAVIHYSHASLLPEFLRGRIVSFLPWYYVGRQHRALKSFDAVINNNQVSNTKLNARLNSFAFFEAAKILAARKQYYEAIEWLAKADAVDADRSGAGEAAEKMRTELFELHLTTGDRKAYR